MNAIEPWIFTSIFGLNTVPVWCSVCHHVTEKCTIGTSANAISAAIAHRLPALVGGRAGAPQREVAEVEEEEDRGGGEPRVPLPPGAPRRAAPERADDEREPGEHDADLGRRAREQVPVGAAGARDEPEHRRDAR